MRVVTVFIFTCLNFLLIGQDHKPPLELMVSIGEDSRSERNAKLKLKKYLSKDYFISNEAPFTLEMDLTIGDLHTINGMDTYTSSTVGITCNLKGPNVGPNSLALELKCKGKSERDLRSKLGTSIVRSRKTMDEIRAFIKAQMSNTLTSCTDVSLLIDAQINQKEMRQAYESLSYYAILDNCETQMKASEDKYIEAHQNHLCAMNTQKAELLANSGNTSKMSEAIDLLMMIAPDAPCASEAIRISELINKNAQELNKNSKNTIVERIIDREKLTPSEWRAWYRKNYRRY